MSFEELSNLLSGVYVRVKADNVPTPQCVDTAQLWARVVGSPRFSGNAVDIFTQAGSSYTQIHNASDNFPQKGDLVIWSGAYNGGPGHVGIATGNNTDTNKFEVLEQNDPTDSEVHIQSYSYTDVLGWLRPNTLPQDQSQALSQCNSDRDTNWNAFVALCSALGVTIDANDKSTTQKNAENAIQALKDQVKSLEQTNTDLKNNVKEVTDQNVTLTNQIQQIQKSDSTAIDEGLKAEVDLKTANQTIESVAGALKSPTDLKSMLSAVDGLSSTKPIVMKIKDLGPILTWILSHGINF